MFFPRVLANIAKSLRRSSSLCAPPALRACNLVRVSSIFPPGCRIMSRSEGIKRLKPGQVTFVVMSEAATREPPG